eukprot:scaffold16904_cov72-Phaeocystis_antarctica.AAC.3
MRTYDRDEIVWQRRALLDCGHRLKKHHTRRARPARVSRCALGAVSYTRRVVQLCFQRRHIPSTARGVAG